MNPSWQPSPSVLLPYGVGGRLPAVGLDADGVRPARLPAAAVRHPDRARKGEVTSG